MGGVAIVVAVITGEADADLFEFAEAAIADEFGGHAEVNVTALLGAGLPDDIGLANGVTHEAALGDGEGEGFFAVDVFACPGGCDCLKRMPMIGGGDLDGVDVRAGEEVAEVFVGGAGAALVIGVDHAAHGLATKGAVLADNALVVAGGFGFDIAHGNDLDAFVIEEVFDDVVGATAAADESEGGAIGRGRFAIETEGTAWDDAGEAHEGGSAGKEAAAVDGVTHPERTKEQSRPIQESRVMPGLALNAEL